MQIDLEGQTFALAGERNLVSGAVLDALLASGGQVGDPCDVMIVSFPIVPREDLDAGPLLGEARASAIRMAGAEDGGRILFILSAAAGMPMRRHPGYSVQMAAAMAAMRCLAMEFGPKVRVNALGVGAIGEPVVAGDAAMLSHASIKRAGTVGEIVDTALFLCDPLNSYMTGQLLCVDGGWSAGYGRNF